MTDPFTIKDPGGLHIDIYTTWKQQNKSACLV
jgi:hypothetical protein